MAFLLIAQPADRRPDESPHIIEARMRGLAAALMLDTSTAPLRDIGPRLTMHHESDAHLALDGCDYDLRVPIGGDWTRFVCDGGVVTVVVGLDPLPASSKRAVVAAYMSNGALTNRLLLGETHAARVSRSRGGQQPSYDELNRKHQELTELVNQHFALLQGRGRAQ
ncbi:hypothetical protein ACH4YO_23935 [Streptomyces noursei]|uniref:hypothetical protein n=1 Tax=Streptomyces noursei TaxID=1971 RepID=UPI0033D57A58